MSISNNKQASPNRTGKGQGSPGKSRLPLILVAGGVVIILLAAFFVYSGSQSSKSNSAQETGGVPVLKVDKERIDFGDVKVDTPVTASFEISNAGDDPLRISQVPKVEVVEGC
jgi:hypothetical protein